MSACCNDPLEMEAKLAMLDAQCTIAQQGAALSVLIADEDDINRDKFNSIKKRTPTPQTVSAYPILFAPTTKDKDNAGLRELTEVIVTTATQDWIDLNFDMAMLDEIDSIRVLISYRGVTYEIKDKNFQSQIGDEFLYVVLGLNRK